MSSDLKSSASGCCPVSRLPIVLPDMGIDSSVVDNRVMNELACLGSIGDRNGGGDDPPSLSKSTRTSLSNDAGVGEMKMARVVAWV